MRSHFQNRPFIPGLCNTNYFIEVLKIIELWEIINPINHHLPNWNIYLNDCLLILFACNVGFFIKYNIHILILLFKSNKLEISSYNTLGKPPWIIVWGRCCYYKEYLDHMAELYHDLYNRYMVKTSRSNLILLITSVYGSLLLNFDIFSFLIEPH